MPSNYVCPWGCSGQSMRTHLIAICQQHTLYLTALDNDVARSGCAVECLQLYLGELFMHMVKCRQDCLHTQLVLETVNGHVRSLRRYSACNHAATYRAVASSCLLLCLISAIHHRHGLVWRAAANHPSHPSEPCGVSQATGEITSVQLPCKHFSKSPPAGRCF